MRKRKSLTLLLAVMMLLTLILGGCKKEDEGPDDVPISLEPAGDVISRYSKDDTDYASKPLEDTKIVRLHYRRNDDTGNNREVYQPWNVWAWDMANGGNGAAYQFTGYDDYGVYADLDLNVISEGKGTDLVGFIVRTDNWSKDPDGDRSIEVEPQSNGGVQNVYVRTQEATVFDTEENACKSIISYAMLRNSNTISAYFKPIRADFKSYRPRFGIKINGEEYKDFTMEEFDDSLKMANLTLKRELNINDVVTVSYRFDNSWINEVDLMLTNYFDTEEFNEKYTYTGDDLGVTFDKENNPGATTFKVWAPTSTAMVLNIYDTGDYMTDKTPLATYDMSMGEKGVYSYTVNEDLDGKYYTYTVTNSKGTNEVVDPYARSAGINGRRGMVVNFTRLNGSIDGWSSDVRPFEGNAVDASIYEIHVRDMTISPTSGVEEKYRGRFLGLAQTGTTYTENGVTVTTGLDHMKELGITHVQIQPFYDYSSVDETRVSSFMSDDNYNWGYDPLNYNVLEGSYSTDPYDGYNRIREFKEMVMAMHKAGLSINMDVVYNHTSASENSNFNLLVPYYYYRTKANGTFYNGSGCGNEMASDRFMVNKFFRESCQFWIDEYHLSGFRFDLMGLIDNQTMIDIYNDCRYIYPQIMIYGEPWTGGATKLKAGTSASNLKGQTTVQRSLGQDFFCGDNVLVGAFNDVIRNAVRGENNPAKGYVQGDNSNTSVITLGIQGQFSRDTIQGANINPNQVLNYVACHDNYTLYDQLVQTMKPERLPMAYTQADSIIFLAEGVPFIQEGEDFMRSKRYSDTGKYEGNSYNVGDFINVMDYSLKVQHNDIFKKTRELIRFRKNTPEFRLASRDEIRNQVKIITAANGNIEYDINDYKIIHSIIGHKVELDGTYEIVYSNVRSSYGTVSGTVSAGTNESLVLKKVN